MTEKVNCNKKEDDKSFLDIDDLLILSVISDLSNRISIRKVILEDGQYSWISYNTILEDLPILRISKKQLRRKLDKLVEFNLIELRIERVKGSGTFVYIKLGKEYEWLLYDTNTDRQKCPEGEGENVYGDRQKCLPKDNITIQDNNNNNKENKDNKLSLSKKGEELPNWKTDFKAYLELVYDAKEKLLANMSIKAKKLEYHPNINYELTIEKMVDEYWRTEDGWKHKIKTSKKSKEIDMVKTLVKGFDIPSNRVYKKASKYSNYANIYPQPNRGLSLHEDGENADGTFYRNGYKYYHSMRDDRDYSIPLNAEPMPSIDCEFNMKTMSWYHPDIKNDVNGDIW
ncbi:MAG: hypothetical protein ACI4TK_04675 [Agathobacter sp.]